jgi:hypothetical protein
MNEILALLDAAIDEVGQTTGSSSRSSRPRGDANPAAGTVKSLKSNGLPALPVVPVQNGTVRDGIEGATERTPASADSHGKYGKGANALEGVRQAREGLSEVPRGRAAVVDFDGKIPRAWADGFARLHPDRPPGDVPERRWMQFIDDIGHFLDQRWAEKAAAFGWGPFDLFGADRERPFARIDHAGLLWLLNGDKLIDLDRHKAVIQTRTGVRQTFHRKPVVVGDVLLPWEPS